MRIRLSRAAAGLKMLPSVEESARKARIRPPGVVTSARSVYSRRVIGRTEDLTCPMN